MPPVRGPESTIIVTGFSPGDRIRVDIPDEEDPDFPLHRNFGQVVEMMRDDAAQETGDLRDSTIYRVELDSGEVIDLRWRDLRPVPE
jgi:hypothetical protein